jgi:hypothetical protein
MVPTPWNDVAFAISGDMQQGQALPSVVWQSTYFHIIASTHVPTMDQMDQLLAAHPNEPAFGPFCQWQCWH